MSKLTVLLLVLSGILSGCIAYDAPYRDEPMHRSDRDREHDYGDHRYDRDHDHDHDRDGDRR
ncbi:MAG TPA: hypothetical protein VIF82_01690 [Burkholderiaceae bacterium]|jgi:hypothetical protein